MPVGKFTSRPLRPLRLGLISSALLHAAFFLPLTDPMRIQSQSSTQSVSLTVRLSADSTLPPVEMAGVKLAEPDSEFRIASLAPNSEGASGTGIHYFEYSEVDAPSVPFDDWNVTQSATEEISSVNLEI